MKLVIVVFNAEMKEHSPFLSLEVLQPPFVVYLLLLWKSPPLLWAPCTFFSHSLPS